MGLETCERFVGEKETGEERERIFNLMGSNWISEFVIRF